MTDILDCFKDMQAQFDPVSLGWRMLLGQKPKKMTTSGGIEIPEGFETARSQEILGSMSQVILLGSLTYQGEHLYPFIERKAFENGGLIEKGYNPERRAWCKVGDWVLHGPNAGFRIPWNGQIYRILNDDEILGVLRDMNGFADGLPTLTHNLTT